MLSPTHALGPGAKATQFWGGLPWPTAGCTPWAWGHLWALPLPPGSAGKQVPKGPPPRQAQRQRLFSFALGQKSLQGSGEVRAPAPADHDGDPLNRALWCWPLPFPASLPFPQLPGNKPLTAQAWTQALLSPHQSTLHIFSTVN